jgi:hypothetical protein
VNRYYSRPGRLFLTGFIGKVACYAFGVKLPGFSVSAELNELPVWCKCFVYLFWY